MKYKQHLLSEKKCDYCEQECISWYSLQFINKDGKRDWYNGHKSCMARLEIELKKELSE